MSFDDARTYLYRVLPWAPIGDPNACINIHWTFQRPGFERPAWSGQACFSINECINVLQYAQRMQDTKDIYVALASMREFEEKVSKNGRHWRRAIRNQENAVELRSLFIDVDVKPGNPEKGYANFNDAARALHKFCNDAGLPRPNVVVSSGGGLHVYWTLAQALKVEQWRPLADALAEATRRFGLHCDTQCTIDAARVLRVPDTFNRKSNPPRPVKLLTQVMLPEERNYTADQMRQALAPYMGARVIPLPLKGKGPASELAAGIELPRAPPVSLDSIAAAGCGFIKTAIETGGKDYDNPLWNLTTLVSTFTEGGVSDAHRMASGHSTYTEAETTALYERKTHERETKDIGWPSCRSIENAGCKSCATCPLKGPSTKPLQFGAPSVRIAPQVVATPGLPNGYTRIGERIHKLVVMKDGTSRLVEVIPFPAFDPWIQSDPNQLNFMSRRWTGGPAHACSIPDEAANSQEKFNKACGGCGIVGLTDQLKMFRDFIVSWRQQLREVKDSVIAAKPYGWQTSPNGKISGFNYGGVSFSPAGEKPAPVPDDVVSKQYRPHGELQPWIDAAKIITSIGPERALFIAVSFGAPLIRFTGENGVLVHAWSPSGYGKSSGVHTGMAVWAQPKLGKQKLDDTQNSVFKKIGTLASLPLYWDEMSDEETMQKFVKAIFQLTEGREKLRLNSDNHIRESGMWETMMLSAANQSILDMVARRAKTHAAGLYRVIEYAVPEHVQDRTLTSASQSFLKLMDNYGHAGHTYAKFLGENHEQVHKEVVGMLERTEKALKIEQAERFWLASIVCIFLGAFYANRLGLTTFNLKELWDFLVKCVVTMRAEVKDQPVDMSNSNSLSTVVQKFFAFCQKSNTIVTNKIHIASGRPAPGSIKLVRAAGLIDGVYIHIGLENKIVRISVSQFHSWLEANGYPLKPITEAMRQQFGMQKVYGVLGAGTSFALMKEYLYEMDYTGTALASLVEFN